MKNCNSEYRSSAGRVGKEAQDFEGREQENETSTEEAESYEQFLAQVVVAEETFSRMEELLMAHIGDAERELKKVLQANNVDIDAHCGGSITGNHCMHMGEKGNAIMDGMKEGMLPKIKDDTNRKHLQAICDRMKPILSPWFEIMKTMKSVGYQSDEDFKKF